MSLTTRVIVALVLGFAAGLLVLAYPIPALLKLVRVVEPIGVLWVNAIRMTVIPLVVSLLITGVASCSNMRAVREIGWGALASFLGLLVFVAAAGLLIVPPLFAWFHMTQPRLLRYAATRQVERPRLRISQVLETGW